MSLNGFEWNEAELEPNHPFNNGVVTLMAFTPGKRPRLIGTAFIVNTSGLGRSALAITAAHNITGIHDVQTPRPLYYSATALPELLPSKAPLSLDRQDVRAICLENGQIEVAEITDCVWDTKADIAFLTLRPQNSASSFFQSYFLIDATVPEIGTEVCIMGFADQALQVEESSDPGKYSFQMSRRLMLRLGTVTAHHLDGHVCCRGPCIETSIPVFPGVSGGVVMRYALDGNMMSFGLVSSDPEDTEENKKNRNIRGNSIVALLGANLVSTEGTEKTFQFKLDNAQIVFNPAHQE